MILLIIKCRQQWIAHAGTSFDPVASNFGARTMQWSCSFASACRGSSGSYCAHRTHCTHFLVWPHCCRVDASSHGGGLLSASWGSEIPNQFSWNLDRLFIASIRPHIQNTVATMIGGLGDRWSCTFLCFLFLECTHRLRRVDCCPMHSSTCFGGGCVPLGLFCLGH